MFERFRSLFYYQNFFFLQLFICFLKPFELEKIANIAKPVIIMISILFVLMMVIANALKVNNPIFLQKLNFFREFSQNFTQIFTFFQLSNIKKRKKKVFSNSKLSRAKKQSSVSRDFECNIKIFWNHSRLSLINNRCTKGGYPFPGTFLVNIKSTFRDPQRPKFRNF